MGRRGTIVELHVPDFDVVKDFYGELGFIVVREKQGEGHAPYLVLGYEDAILCFWPGNESMSTHPYFSGFPQDAPRGIGVEIVIMVSNIDDLFTRAQILRCVVEGIEQKPWGVRDFRIADPFGYYLRFSEAHDVLDGNKAE